MISQAVLFCGGFRINLTNNQKKELQQVTDLLCEYPNGVK